MDTYKFYKMLLRKGLISRNQAIVRMNREQAVVNGAYDSTEEEEYRKEARTKDRDAKSNGTSFTGEI